MLASPSAFPAMVRAPLPSDPAAPAPSPSPPKPKSSLPTDAHTPSGLQLSDPTLTLRIDALRPDVLRVRIYPNGHPAEDASWAVIPTSRTARIAVTPSPTASPPPTSASPSPPTSASPSPTSPATSSNPTPSPSPGPRNGFTVTKSKSFDDHFFGLGDKPGPLDRNGEAFTMWNTDSFGWQESTDPIYKSIPFFLEMHNGRTIGVLFDNTYRTFFDFGRKRPHPILLLRPRRPTRLLHPLRPRPQTSSRNLRLANRPHAAPTPLVPRLPAVPLQLHPRVAGRRHRRPPPPRQDPRRRHLARHRLPIQVPPLHRRPRNLPRLPRPNPQTSRRALPHHRHRRPPHRRRPQPELRTLRHRHSQRPVRQNSTAKTT